MTSTSTSTKSGLSKRTLLLAALIAAGVQTAALAHMVYGRVTLLKTGREIIAEVIPVDPRDLFRGDYVILGYSFTAQPDLDLPLGSKTGDVVYATLHRQEGNKWLTTGVATTYPAQTAADDIVLKGRVAYAYPSPKPGILQGRLRFGIESYFVPEGTGLDLEKQVREHKIEAVLAVGPDGEAGIKALIVDGQRAAEDPLL